MKTQFIHKMESSDWDTERYTLAIVPPKKSDLFDGMLMLQENQKINISFQIGVAKLHPKEKDFVKSVGRQVAEENLTSVVAELIEANVNNVKTYFTLRNVEDGTLYYFMLTHGYVYPFFTGKNY